jgi:hypothetical protein
MTARTGWHLLRTLRWLLWAAFLGFSLMFWLDRPSYVNQFGHLLMWVEAVMFGLPVAAVFVGFMEMVTREKAGIVRVKPAAER